MIKIPAALIQTEPLIYHMDEWLPDGERISVGGAVYRNGIVHNWTGRKCRHCDGTGHDLDDLRCVACGGTGEQYGPMYMWEG